MSKNIHHSHGNPTEQYELLEKIGQGGFGYVYKARDTTTNKIVAAKLINLEEGENELEDVQEEIAVMSNCNCDQLTKYFASYLSGSQLWIVMEYMEGGALSSLLADYGPIRDEESISFLLRELLKAISYLHTERKIHRDIKSGNILLGSNGAIKLADFGVTRQLTESINKRQTRVGTPYWMAPEVISESQYDIRADIWSVGITGIEIAEGSPPKALLHPLQAIFSIPKDPPPTLSSQFSDSFSHFLSQCLQKNPADRLTANQLLQHPFILSAPSSIPSSLLAKITTTISTNSKRNTIERILSINKHIGSSSINIMSSSSWNFNSMVKRSKSSDSNSSTGVNGSVVDTVSAVAELEMDEDAAVVTSTSAGVALPGIDHLTAGSAIDTEALLELLQTSPATLPSDLYSNVVIPTLTSTIATIDAMQGDSGPQRDKNRMIISTIQKLLLHLDVQSDGYLTSEVLTTIMSHMIEELDGIVER